MPARQQGNFCSFGVVNLDRQPVVKIIRQRGVNLVRQEVIFYASFSSKTIKYSIVNPNDHGDWINLRNTTFEDFIPLAPFKKFDNSTISFFNTYAIGLATNRDSWVGNFSASKINKNMKVLIDFFNTQRKLFISAKQNNLDLKVEDFVESDATKISWTRALRRDLQNNIVHNFSDNCISTYYYRPFQKMNLYYDKKFIESPGLNLKLFPSENNHNLVITIPGLGERKGFATLIASSITDLNMYDGGSQSFPLFYYEEIDKINATLFDNSNTERYLRKDGISDFIFNQARSLYGNRVLKEDIFYYVYGFLHSLDFREQFVNDLKKMLPRLPLLETVKEFWAFSKAGRELAELHLHYENVSPYPGVIVNGDDGQSYKVGKMRFPSKGQKDTIIYNSKITISNIPEEAYEYVVNGKSAIEWIMERYQVTIDKKSGIKNDPNDWATEVGNPRYILDLLLSIINVSVKTMEIVKNLPKVKFE